MDEWIEYAEEMKEDLGLNVAPFADLDPRYLIAIINWKVPIGLSKDERSEFAELGDPDEWEFIGDATMHIITTTMLTEQKLTVGQLSQVRSLLERNVNLQQLGIAIGVCSELHNPMTKACADIFEALVGAMYLHAFYVKNERYEALDAIEDWFINLGFEEQIAEFSEQVRTETTSRRQYGPAKARRVKQ